MRSRRTGRGRPTSRRRTRAVGPRSRGRTQTTACARTRTASSPGACGKATTSPSSRETASTGRSSTSRSRRSAQSAFPCTPPAPHATSGICWRTPRRWRSSARTRRQLAKVEEVASELPSLQHVLTFHDLDGLATHGRDFAAANPERARRRDLSDRRGRSLHDHLHLRHDRPSEGLHALESQLPRDGDGRRPDGGDVLPPRRRHAPVPPACAQLRAVDAAARAHTSGSRSRSSPILCVSPRPSRRSAPRSCRAFRACTRRCTPRSWPSSTPRRA